jgi:hypothetical protein
MENGFDPMAAAGLGVGLIILIIVLALWEAVWKGFAMWKAARDGQKAWYVCLLIFNTIGILPILYIYVFGKKVEDSTKV